MSLKLTRKEILEKAYSLPAFPHAVIHVLNTLNDPGASMVDLASYIERDPVMTGRVVAQANVAARMGMHEAKLENVYTAAALLGISKLREVVASVCLADFFKGSRVSSGFWDHSAGVAMVAQELANRTGFLPDFAFIAGLLHDVGQLWMERFYRTEFSEAQEAVKNGNVTIVQSEQLVFGMDHMEVGVCLGEYWGLPKPIQDAILGHHRPDPRGMDKLVAIVHVAEVMANALDLGQRDTNQVTVISPEACALLHIDFREDMQHLLGTLEARTRYAANVFYRHR